MPNVDAFPSSVELFYDESKAARDVMDQLLIRYRTNTTAVLALATGAATFFGFSNSAKGLWFVAAICAYAVAAGFAIAIYWPTPWRVNVAYNVEKTLLTAPPTPSVKLRWDLALGHQQAIAQSLKVVGGPKGRTGQALKFRILLLATALVVVFAGTNSFIASRHSITTPPPTHVVIDPVHIDTDPAHISVNLPNIVIDPVHGDIGKAPK